MTDHGTPFVTVRKIHSSRSVVCGSSGEAAVAELQSDHSGPLHGASESIGSNAKDGDPAVYRHADIDGAKTAYLRMGRGEPVLLLHGIGSYSYIWRNVVPLLTDRFEVIVPDLLGCGYSTAAPNKPLDLRAQYEQILRFIQTLGIPSLHVVGHDFGGAIAQLLAIHSPEVVKTLMLVNSIGYDYWPVTAVKAARFPIVRQLVIGLLDKTVFASMLRRAVYFPERLTKGVVDQYRLPYRAAAARRTLMRLLRSLEHGYLVSEAPGLKHLTMPACVVRAANDVYLSRAIAVRLAADIPTARLVEIDEAGHFVQEDKPERVAELFLELAGADGERRTR